MESNLNSSEISINKDKDVKCAPGNKFENGSCIPLDLLVEMAKTYNQEQDNKIKLYQNFDTLNPKKYKLYLVKEFRKRLKNICDDQKCWIKQKFINNMKKELKHYLKKNTFRPSGPQGKFTWLNTLNINNVMNQYENKHEDFLFKGAVPIDFDDLPDLEIANMDFNELLNKNISKIGFVFNLDEHWKSGSHWVALFSDIKNNNTYFFDSYGIRPEKRIRKLMRRFEKFYKQKGGSEPTILYNKHRHQYKGSECGVYSINFIVRLLEGESFEHITRNKTLDDEMNECRKKYFF